MGSDTLGLTPLEPIDLLDLAAARVDDLEGRVQRIFEWQLERQSLALNLTFSAVAASLLALLSALLKGNTPLHPWHIAVLGTAIFVSFAIAGFSLRARAFALYRGAADPGRSGPVDASHEARAPREPCLPDEVVGTFDLWGA